MSACTHACGVCVCVCVCVYTESPVKFFKVLFDKAVVQSLQNLEDRSATWELSAYTLTTNSSVLFTLTL